MTVTARREAMIWGSFVADAASMGLHWLYDQDRIRQVAPQSPEFLEPLEQNFAGVPAFFAHAGRSAGDFSQYGEQQMVMLQSLAGQGGYDRSDYQTRFRDHFGYGGTYVGYIDHPTSDTLDQLKAIEKNAFAVSRSINPNIDGRTNAGVVPVILAKLATSDAATLQQDIEAGVRAISDDDELVAYALEVTTAVSADFDFPGADDTQLPAVSKLPVLVARHLHDDDLQQIVENAVRVTNNNDIAVAYAAILAQLLQDALLTGALPDVQALSQTANPVVADAISKALARTSETTEAVTADIGMSCPLDYGVPSIIHNLATAKSFEDGIHANIYAGGDSCGRSIVLGAMLGAIHGVPLDWINRLTQQDAVAAHIKALDL